MQVLRPYLHGAVGYFIKYVAASGLPDGHSETELYVATPLKECIGVPTASSVFCVVTMATTSWLFLRRVHAVYADKRYVRWFFSFLWVAASGALITLSPGTSGKHIPDTNYCTVYAVKRWAPLNDFMPAIFDTLVFIAVSYRLAFQTHQELGAKTNWTAAWFSTKGLPTISRAMLQGGQQYFLSVKFHQRCHPTSADTDS